MLDILLSSRSFSLMKKNQKIKPKIYSLCTLLAHARIFGIPTHLNPKDVILNKILSVCSRVMACKKPRNEVRKCLNLKK